MSDDITAAPGRLVLVTGTRAPQVGAQVARALRAAHVDGSAVAAMLPAPVPDARRASSATGPAARPDWAPGLDLAALERTFMRYTAGIALADVFRFAGHDVVVTDDVPADLLDDYLDFAAPTTVHVVRLSASAEHLPVPRRGPGLRVAVDALDEAEAAATVVDRLHEAAVDTPSQDASGGGHRAEGA